MKKIALTVSTVSMLFLMGCNFNDATAEEEDVTSGYIRMVNHTFDDSTEILNLYQDALDEYYAGDMSDGDFKTQMQHVLGKSNVVLNNLDLVQYEVDLEILDFHGAYLAHLHGQHDLILNGLSLVVDDHSGGNLTTLRREYVETKENHDRMIQELRLILNPLDDDLEEDRGFEL
ncbi:hypothetical protein DH09_00405 (plasmid) [Bacillaceae bacterium JMAK1]|nr:hypothetical protein DH09_00405 [Bacillaceae bacterium JMAK1]